MKKLIAALAIAVSAIAPASAETLQNAFGNTIVVTTPGGEALYHFNADGTFTGVAPGGSTMAGRWTAEGDQLCMISPNGQQQCTAVTQGKNVGDTWTQQGTDGSEIQVELRAGR